MIYQKLKKISNILSFFQILNAVSPQENIEKPTLNSPLRPTSSNSEKWITKGCHQIDDSRKMREYPSNMIQRRVNKGSTAQSVIYSEPCENSLIPVSEGYKPSEPPEKVVQTKPVESCSEQRRSITHIGIDDELAPLGLPNETGFLCLKNMAPKNISSTIEPGILVVGKSSTDHKIEESQENHIPCDREIFQTQDTSTLTDEKYHSKTCPRDSSKTEESERPQYSNHVVQCDETLPEQAGGAISAPIRLHNSSHYFGLPRIPHLPHVNTVLQALSACYSNDLIDIKLKIPDRNTKLLNLFFIRMQDIIQKGIESELINMLDTKKIGEDLKKSMMLFLIYTQSDTKLQGINNPDEILHEIFNIVMHSQDPFQFFCETLVAHFCTKCSRILQQTISSTVDSDFSGDNIVNHPIIEKTMVRIFNIKLDEHIKPFMKAVIREMMKNPHALVSKLAVLTNNQQEPGDSIFNRLYIPLYTRIRLNCGHLVKFHLKSCIFQRDETSFSLINQNNKWYHVKDSEVKYVLNPFTFIREHRDVFKLALYKRNGLNTTKSILGDNLNAFGSTRPLSSKSSTVRYNAADSTAKPPFLESKQSVGLINSGGDATKSTLNTMILSNDKFATSVPFFIENNQINSAMWALRACPTFTSFLFDESIQRSSSINIIRDAFALIDNHQDPYNPYNQALSEEAENSGQKILKCFCELLDDHSSDSQYVFPHDQPITLIQKVLWAVSKASKRVCGKMAELPFNHYVTGSSSCKTFNHGRPTIKKEFFFSIQMQNTPLTQTLNDSLVCNHCPNEHEKINISVYSKHLPPSSPKKLCCLIPDLLIIHLRRSVAYLLARSGKTSIIDFKMTLNTKCGMKKTYILCSCIFKRANKSYSLALHKGIWTEYHDSSAVLILDPSKYIRQNESSLSICLYECVDVENKSIS